VSGTLDVVPPPQTFATPPPPQVCGLEQEAPGERASTVVPPQLFEIVPHFLPWRRERISSLRRSAASSMRAKRGRGWEDLMGFPAAPRLARRIPKTPGGRERALPLVLEAYSDAPETNGRPF
jgi:hypothetical protein